MDNSYKVIELEKFGGQLKVASRSFRELRKDEYLIKMMCSTIHPADLSFLNGTYGTGNEGLTKIIPGFEGSGIIEKVGSEGDQSLVGKRVSVFSSAAKDKTFEGLWTQYHYTTIHHFRVFDDIDYQKIALAMGNPMTAVGFLDTLRKHNVDAVVQNGASSAFGKMFIRLCKQEGIKTINIVRKEEHIELLKKLGATYVISTIKQDWEKELEKLAGENKATVCFECVGGDYTGRMLTALPNGSTLYHFGNLELKRLNNIDVEEFMTKSKTIKGWWLKNWLMSIDRNSALEYAKRVRDDLTNDGGIFHTDDSKVFTIDQIEQAFEYYLTHMSEGKIILKLNEYN
jgi:NADPH2:quinone reductase